MFNEKYDFLDSNVRRILRDVQLPSIDRVREILQHQKPSLDELAELLEIGQYDHAEEQFNIVRDFTHSRFRTNQNVLRNISPIYLSSYCVDICSYCNYSAKRRNVQRTRLSIADLEQEVSTVINEGNKVIEFALGTDPIFTPEKLAEYILRTKELLKGETGSGVLICSDYFSREDYELLKKAGLWGIIQWDETLDRNMYGIWHNSSPRKSNFKERINNHDRAIQTGLQVAIGCLFGLNDYRYDVLMQIAKARYLRQEYGVNPFVFGTPRLKPIAGKLLHPKSEVNDRQYEISLMVYKIGEPQVSRWLQTRESLDLNMRNALDKDAITYCCGRVKPGGYRVNATKIDNCKGGQFEVNELETSLFEDRIKEQGFCVNRTWIPQNQ